MVLDLAFIRVKIMENIYYGRLRFKRLFELGYCKKELSLIETRLDSKGELYYFYRFRTFTYSSLNLIYSAFYVNGRKVLSSFIKEYLSAEALAHWCFKFA